MPVCIYVCVCVYVNNEHNMDASKNSLKEHRTTLHTVVLHCLFVNLVQNTQFLPILSF